MFGSHIRHCEVDEKQIDYYKYEYSSGYPLISVEIENPNKIEKTIEQLLKIRELCCQIPPPPQPPFM